MAITLTKTALREWAQAKPEGAIVGIAGSFTSCPIAQYIADNDAEDIVVGTHARYYIAGRRHRHILPPALSIVVDRVDANILNKVITRETFLAILGG